MKRIVGICLLGMMVVSMSASKPMRQWITAMPDSVLPLLTQNDRLDFVDFLDSGMEAVVTNRLDGKSVMRVLTNDYTHVSYTKSMEVEMKLLPLTDTTDVLCMVTTVVSAGVGDSHITFFDENWQVVPTDDYYIPPVMDDFLVDELPDSVVHVLDKMDVYFKTYHLDPEKDELVCRLTTTDYLNTEDRKAVLPWVLSASRTYVWRNGKLESKVAEQLTKE